MENKALFKLLGSTLFDPAEHLNWLDRAKVSYDRFRALNAELKINRQDVMNFSKKLQLIHEWVGCVDGTLMTIMSIHYNLCLGSILRLGTKTPAVEKVIAELESLESFGVYLGTELGYGNNLFGLQTRAEYDPSKKIFKLTTPSVEAKKYMPNTGHPEVPKIAVVFARLFSRGEDCGIHPFIVRIRAKSGELCPGVQVSLLGEKPGYHLDNAVTTFNNVEIPYDFILLGDESRLTPEGEFSSQIKSPRRRFLNAIDAVQAGKLSFAGAISTGALVGCKIAYRYASQKRTFAPQHEDVPLLSYNNQKMDIYTSFAKSLAIKALYVKSLHVYSRNPIVRDEKKTLYSSMAKYFSSSQGQEVFLRLRERLGAQGMFCHNRVIEYLNYVFGIVSAEGDNQVIQLKIAKDLVFEKKLRDWLFSGNWSRRKSLMSAEHCFDLIKSRENLLVRDIKTSFFVGKIKSKSTYTIWNEEINRSLQLGEVHVLRVALGEMLDRADEGEIHHDARLVKQMAHLVMLDYIQKHQGWFLCKGLISNRQVERWNQSMNKILQSLELPMSQALEEIEAPPELLRSPLLSGTMTESFAQF